MKLCDCGHQCNSDANFCPKCGRKFEVVIEVHIQKHPDIFLAQCVGCGQPLNVVNPEKERKVKEVYMSHIKSYVFNDPNSVYKTTCPKCQTCQNVRWRWF